MLGSTHKEWRLEVWYVGESMVSLIIWQDQSNQKIFLYYLRYSGLVGLVSLYKTLQYLYNLSQLSLRTYAKVKVFVTV